MNTLYSYKKYITPKNDERTLIIYEIEGMNFFSSANKYLKTRNGREVGPYTDDSDYVRTIVRFLNYLFYEENIFFDEDAEMIEFSMVQNYLDIFCTSPTARTGEEPCQLSRKRERGNLSKFSLNLKEENVCPEFSKHEIASYTKIGNRKNGNYELLIYTDARTERDYVIRDTPQFFIDVLFEKARIYDPDVFVLASLQRFAGLRPSEACNVRGIQSVYGAGYTITRRLSPDTEGLVPQSISIDLKRKAQQRPLRTDGKYIGGIKRPRLVDVHPSYVQPLTECLTAYESVRQLRRIEETDPLVTNKSKTNGYNMAMSYRNYDERFHNIIDKYVVPELLARGGLEAVYAKELTGNSYGPHMLREFFTCELVRHGCSWYEIMHYRGDKGVHSAVIYLLKGGLVREVINVGKETLSQAIKEKMAESDEKQANAEEKRDIKDYRRDILPFKL